jgi:hypothetical protein
MIGAVVLTRDPAGRQVGAQSPKLDVPERRP